MSGGVPGRLIGVVGPSGVGKDTVMQALCAAHHGLRHLRRVITRPPGPDGEDFERISTAAFDARAEAGAFALQWAAHELRYGIPHAGCAPLAEGTDLIVNLSRGVLMDAQAQFPAFTVLALHAPQDVLAARLAARGREGSAQIAARLAQAERPLPEGLRDVIRVTNDGDLAGTVREALAQIYPQSAVR